LAAALNVAIALHKKLPAASLLNTPAITFPPPSFSYTTTNSGFPSLFVSTPNRIPEAKVIQLLLVAGLSNVVVVALTVIELVLFATENATTSPRGLKLGPLSCAGSVPLAVVALAAVPSTANPTTVTTTTAAKARALIHERRISNSALFRSHTCALQGYCH
jgi:hypothetical protein